MLIKLLKEEKPDVIAVAFDRAAPTFRHKQYEEYKAHRPPMPEELRGQFPLAKQILDALGIAIFELNGFEADDILGTITKKAEQEDYEVLIVTGDKDAYQLISSKTKIMSTKKGITDIVVYDREKVIERYGLPPEKMIEMLSLKGDTSDNIPGVPGIGDKIASRLIQEFGNLEGVLANIDKVKGQKIQETLRNYAEQARMSRELATLDCDVPIEIDIDRLRPRFDKEKAREVFSAFEFNTLLKRLDIEEPSKTMGEESGQLSLLSEEIPVQADEYRLPENIQRVETDEDLADLCRQLEKTKEVVLSLELSEETVNAAVLALAISFEAEKVFLIEFKQGGLSKAAVLERLRFFLESEAIHKVVHDGKVHHIAWENEGIDLKGLRFDSMLAAYLIDAGEGKYIIPELAKKYLSVSMSSAGQASPAQKVALIQRLQPLLAKKMEQDGLVELFDEIELPLSRVLARMEVTGVGVDIEALKRLGQDTGAAIARLDEDIRSLAGTEFNISSPQQLGFILFEKLQLPVEKKTKTGYSTDVGVLTKLRPLHPVIDKILEYRELTKLKSTYIDALPRLTNPKTGRIHTSFNQTGTSTGRLSSSNPNLQNIPVRTESGLKIREAFVPTRPGDKLLVADYSQIELRLLAHLSEDETLLRFFQEDKDIHAATAAEVFGAELGGVTAELRRRAKAINFGIVYGISAYGLAEQLGASGKEAQSYIDRYFERFPAVKRYRQKAVEDAYRQGYVKTLLGRRRSLPELHSPVYSVRNFGERLAINTPLQGTAADIIKIAMVRLDQRFEANGLTSRMVLQVHDELVFEVPPEEEEVVMDIVREEMEHAYPLAVRLTVDMATGLNWREAK